MEPEATYDLRRRVLRQHLPGSAVANPQDRLPGTRHLAVTDEAGAVVAVATVFPEATPHRPGARSLRLRGMAVDPVHRGRGAGRLLLDAVVERARCDSFEVVWGNGRDSALDFYTRHGWRVVGEGFVALELPHHVVVADL